MRKTSGSRTADPQFAPGSWRGLDSRAAPRVLGSVGSLIPVQLFARLFKLQEKFVRFAQKIDNQVRRRALA